MASQTATVATRRGQSFLARHAWKGLAVISGITAFFGLTDIIDGAADLQGGETALMHSLTGMSWNDLQAATPAAAHLIDWKFRSDGATLLVLGLLALAICLGGLRQRRRWAWYALWSLPLWMALTVVSVLTAITHPGYGTPVPVISGSILGAVSTALLALSYPKGTEQVGGADGK